MSITIFDEYADSYDAWFLRNPALLGSEVLLLKEVLGNPGKALSVGCGSGLFESILRRDHGIEIAFGVEPAEGMARIAARRGLNVKEGVAEALPYGDGEFDTTILNGTPSYTSDLEKAFAEAKRVLRAGGRIVVLDVPAESSYGLLYQFASLVGRWDDPRLAGLPPEHPYPVEFAASARWRTTPQKLELLQRVGFLDLACWQTLTRHPRYSNDSVEQPSEGYDRGDYVAIAGTRP